MYRVVNCKDWSEKPFSELSQAVAFAFLLCSRQRWDWWREQVWVEEYRELTDDWGIIWESKKNYKPDYGF